MLRFVTFFTFSVSLALVGCATASENPDEATAPTTQNDGVVVSASAETQTELGISQWRVETSGNTTLVDGTSAAGDSIFGVKSETANSPAEALFSVRGREGAAELELRVNGDRSLEILRSSLREHPLYLRSLELLEQDLRSSANALPSAPTLATSALKGTTLRIQDEGPLVQEACASLVTKCDRDIRLYQGAVIAAGNFCAKLCGKPKDCPQAYATYGDGCVMAVDYYQPYKAAAESCKEDSAYKKCGASDGS